METTIMGLYRVYRDVRYFEFGVKRSFPELCGLGGSVEGSVVGFRI